MTGILLAGSAALTAILFITGWIAARANGWILHKDQTERTNTPMTEDELDRLADKIADRLRKPVGINTTRIDGITADAAIRDALRTGKLDARLMKQGIKNAR